MFSVLPRSTERPTRVYHHSGRGYKTHLTLISDFKWVLHSGPAWPEWCTAVSCPLFTCLLFRARCRLSVPPLPPSPTPPLTGTGKPSRRKSSPQLKLSECELDARPEPLGRPRPPPPACACIKFPFMLQNSICYDYLGQYNSSP